MSIDIYCYSKLELNESDAIIKSLRSNESSIFEIAYQIFNSIPADALAQEIASENGLMARSVFLVHMEKQQEFTTPERVATALKRAFGSDNVLVLLQNEKVL